VRNRDPDAWHKFSRIFGPLIYGWCRRKGLQPTDAADCVQDVFGTILSAIMTFRRDRPGSSFQGWIWTITQSRIADHFRSKPHERQVRDSEFNAAEDGGDPQSLKPSRSWQRDLIRRVVQQLQTEFQPEAWQSFWRMAVEGEPAQQIAQDLQISAAAVRQAKYRVLRRLRSELTDLAGSSK
jgi:RNA polymerase sigma-70 factor (ECF subfamily)